MLQQEGRYWREGTSWPWPPVPPPLTSLSARRHPHPQQRMETKASSHRRCRHPSPSDCHSSDLIPPAAALSTRATPAQSAWPAAGPTALLDSHLLEHLLQHCHLEHPVWPQDSLCVLGIATLCPANSGYCHPPGVPCGWDPPGPGCFLCHRSCAELPHMQPLPAMRTELPTDCPMTGREPVISLVTFLSDSCSPLMGQLLLLSCPPHPAAPGHIPGPDCTGVHMGPGSLTLCSATLCPHLPPAPGRCHCPDWPCHAQLLPLHCSHG